jgi:hypothetical protein
MELAFAVAVVDLLEGKLRIEICCGENVVSFKWTT